MVIGVIIARFWSVLLPLDHGLYGQPNEGFIQTQQMFWEKLGLPQVKFWVFSNEDGLENLYLL